jgi:hypothetical protein
MRKMKIISYGKKFCIQDYKSKDILDNEGEFSFFVTPALIFDTESAAWSHVIRKGLLFATEVIGRPETPFNFDEKLIPLFESLISGRPVKSITCFSGEVNKGNRDKDFIIKDFFAEYYLASIASNYDGNKYYDLVEVHAGASEKKEVQFYMNWVISFELYN